MPFEHVRALESLDQDPAAKLDIQGGPGVEEVKSAAAQFGPESPQRYVDILKAHGTEHEAIMAAIHQLLGMKFAAQVVHAYKQTEDDGLVEDEPDDGTVDQPATVMPAPAPTVAEAAKDQPKDEGVVDSDDGIVTEPTAVAAPPTAAAPALEPKKPDDGTVDTLPDDGTVDGLAAGLDETTNAKAEWILAAEKYNAAHAQHVAEFNQATGGVCLGDNGELDAKKVAEWQAQKGLDPDGKVGKKTLEAANGTAAAAIATPAPAKPTADPNEKQIGGA